MNTAESGECQPPSFRLHMLGPVAGWWQGQRIDLGPPLQQATLCMLAGRLGRVVTKEKLINGIWGESPPKTSEQSVYTYVAGLRRVMEPGRGPRGPFTSLLNVSQGYTLLRGPVHIDAEDFEHHLAEARRLRAKGDHRASLQELDTALKSWSGPALCGVPGPFADAERARLEALRLTTGEERADVLLRLGHHAAAAAALTDLVREDPLRERARELLMLALYRCGRQADALNAYLEIRHLLAEKLGVDPGESLRRCYELILHADPSLEPPAQDEGRFQPELSPPSISPADEPPATPHQLPRDVTGFVGRTAELVQLRSLLAPWDGGGPQAVVAITGTAGAGKSAVAIHTAHAVSDHFPGGQLYANLLGATPGMEQLKPVDVLGRFLRALGVHAEAVPCEPDEAAAMLRDRLEGRRVLIVLDDASGPNQVRPLLDLPSGNAVLITSRESFAIVNDCAQLRLGRMPHSESVTMLAKLVGAERIAANPAGATRLVNLCGALPLALRLAAARLIDRPQWSLTDLVTRLEDRRRTLQELESGQVAVGSSLQLSYDQLSRSHRPIDREAARTLCHLGVLHVPEVTAHVVAALLGSPVDLAERALGRLMEAHMAEPGEAAGFQLHDLVRLFTIELSETHLTPRMRHQALTRAVDLYGATTRLAIKLMDPHRVQPSWPEITQGPVPLGGRLDAQEWLENERANIVAAASQALSSEDEAVTRRGAKLGFTVEWHLYCAGHRSDNVSIQGQALHGGRRVGDQEIVALAHGYLGKALSRVGRHSEAAAHQETELALLRSLGDRFGEMRALGNLSVVYGRLRRYEDGLRCAQAQLAICRQISSDVGERHALHTIGKAYRGLGNLAAATAALTEALSRTQEAGDLYQEAVCLTSLAEICLDEHDAPSAKTHLENALRCAREVGYREIESECFCYLARADRLLGQPRSSIAYAQEAMKIARALGDHIWEDMAAQELSAIRNAFPDQLTPPSRPGTLP